MSSTAFVATQASLTDMLQNVVEYGTIEEMWKGHIKGGQCDCYGLSNSRGGSDRTKTLHRNCQTNAAQRRDAGVQDRQRLAHRQDRVRGVEEATTKSIQETGSGKLTNWPVSSVATSSSQTGLQSTGKSYCTSLLHAHY